MSDQITLPQALNILIQLASQASVKVSDATVVAASLHMVQQFAQEVSKQNAQEVADEVAE